MDETTATGVAGIVFELLQTQIQVVGRPTLPPCVLEAVIEEAELDEDIKYKDYRPVYKNHWGVTL